jgi:hypothetical protein
MLDFVSLDQLDTVSSVLLEQPEPKLGEPSSSRQTMRLAPFWSWRGVHLAIAQDGVSWRLSPLQHTLRGGNGIIAKKPR